jgi:hypothetical protein
VILLLLLLLIQTGTLRAGLVFHGIGRLGDEVKQERYLKLVILLHSAFLKLLSKLLQACI